jgi:hypothetical protein
MSVGDQGIYIYISLDRWKVRISLCWAQTRRICVCAKLNMESGSCVIHTRVSGKSASWTNGGLPTYCRTIPHALSGHMWAAHLKVWVFLWCPFAHHNTAYLCLEVAKTCCLRFSPCISFAVVFPPLPSQTMVELVKNPGDVIRAASTSPRSRVSI